jgi:hypothetical protein
MCARLGEKRIEKCEEEKRAVMAKQKRQGRVGGISKMPLTLSS